MDALMQAYIPPSVLISVDGRILELFGDLTNFITLKDAKTDFNLFSILHPAFRTELRGLAHSANPFETRVTRPAKIEISGEIKRFQALVRPVVQRKDGLRLLLITFEDLSSLDDEGVTVRQVDLEDESRVQELEHELAITRESLQTVIEELETGNEELQSLNEESQAANEELQATNEELTTVNDELTTRTYQLGLATDDLTNILNSSGLAILVVDRALVIRRFNEAAQDFFCA